MICWIIANVRWERLAIIRSYLSIIASLTQFLGHGWISRWWKHLSAWVFWVNILLKYHVMNGIFMDNKNKDKGNELKKRKMWHIYHILGLFIKWGGGGFRHGFPLHPFPLQHDFWINHPWLNLPFIWVNDIHLRGFVLLTAGQTLNALLLLVRVMAGHLPWEDK